MKRVVLALMMAAISIPVTGANAAELITAGYITGVYNPYGSGNHFVIDALKVEDAVSGAKNTFVCIQVKVVSGARDDGCGSEPDLILDPTGSVGRLVARVEGDHGPITFEATYVSTGVTYNPFLYDSPTVGVYLGDDLQSINANFTWSRFHGTFLNAKITSGVGSFEAPVARAAVLVNLTYLSVP